MFLEIIGRLSGGLVLGLGGIGSCLGILAAAQAAAGAWAAEGKAGKNPSFQYVIMIAAPISQTLYAMIVMMNGMMAIKNVTPHSGMVMLGVAIGVGLIELASAWGQGLVGAAGVRCLNENGGKGFGFIIVALGIIETVGIFGMVFGLMLLGSVAG